MPRSAPGLQNSFTVSEGLQAGLTRAELRHDGWSKPFRGVRAFEAPSSVRDLAHAYAAKMPPGQYFSHTTAAVLHGVWLPDAIERRPEVHVAAAPGRRQPRGVGVRGHLLIPRRGGVTTRDGLRVAGLHETWCQLATILGQDDLIVAGESVLARNRTDRLPLAALAHAVAAGDRPRQALLNRTLPQLREGVRSPRETQLRRLLVAGGLPEPEINVDLFDEQGRWVKESALVYRLWRILIEYEGELHLIDQRVQLRDIHLYELLQDLGWRVIRVTKDDLRFRREEVVERVRSAIASRS